MQYAWLYWGPDAEIKTLGLIFFLVFIAAANLYMFVLGPWWERRKDK